MTKELLNSFFAKYGDLSVPLKSPNFAQPCPILDCSVPGCNRRIFGGKREGYGFLFNPSELNKWVFVNAT